MSWLFYAVLARLLYASSNLFDQYIARFGKERPLPVVVIVEYMAFIPFLIAGFFYSGDMLKMDQASFLWFGVGSFFAFVGSFPYMYIYKEEPAYNLSPLLQLSPILVTVASFFLFGDSLHGMQWLGAAIVVMCSVLFSWNFSKKCFRLRAIYYMAMASFCFATYQLTLRYGAKTVSVEQTVFWVLAGESFCSFLCLVFLPRIRASFIDMLREGGRRIVAPAFSQAVVGIAAVALLTKAYSLAPSAGHVAAVSGIQSVFVFLLSALIGGRTTGHFQKIEWNLDAKVKILTVLVMAVGIGLLKLS